MYTYTNIYIYIYIYIYSYIHTTLKVGGVCIPTQTYIYSYIHTTLKVGGVCIHIQTYIYIHIRTNCPSVCPAVPKSSSTWLVVKKLVIARVPSEEIKPGKFVYFTLRKLGTGHQKQISIIRALIWENPN